MKKYAKRLLLFAVAAVLIVTTVLLIPSNNSTVKAKGITVYFKWKEDTPHLYYENINGEENTPISYPGVPMKQEDNGWYSYTINEAKSADVMFVVPAKDFQTTSLNREEGEWWFDEGTWYATNPDDKTDIKEAGKNKNINSNKDNVVQVDYSDIENVNAEAGDMIVHFVSDWSSANIYYWNSLPKNEEIAWPGNKMEKDNNGYYTYTFKGLSKVNLLFNNGKEQTEDLTLKKPGEWWYKNGKWTDYDPAKEQPITTPAPFERTDFRDETIYFLMTTRFYDGDSSNNRYCWDDEALIKSETNNDPGWRGDFKGLIEKLDYIKALGFSAIWITPVVENASGLDYHGYHAYDFSKVDSRYESSDCTYQDLINAAHKKGIKVVQDIVLNHTGNWGERNLFHMFDKDEDTGDSKSAFMSVAKDGEKYSNLVAGVKMKGQGQSSYEDLANLPDDRGPGAEYDSRLAAMKQDSIDTDRIYHHHGMFEWESYEVQLGQMAGDCVDINTENPKVSKYIRDSYIDYINMGVDAFRIDTVKHISRLTFNKEFLPQFKKAGGDNFFMFGEACVLRNEIWNAGMPGISVCFYSWNESKDYAWGDTLTNEKLVEQHFKQDNADGSTQPTSDNAFLNGNTYHTPDRSRSSGMDMIDFYVHHKFESAGGAFSAALEEDRYFNDSTWNVTYVDSHDYGPNAVSLNQRFTGSQDTWAENLNLMFTFRGIPCIYYGSEIEFMKGAPIDPMVNNARKPYKESGRAYFGDEIEGTVNTTDYGVYSGATGKMKETLDYPLAKHIQRLNLIRRAVPALRKGQYSTEGVSGGLAFKRRYTEGSTDSFVCVALSGGATFSGVPSGTYVDMVTGKSVDCDGTLTVSVSGKGNMGVYVLQTAGAPNGKVGEDGTYLK